MKSFNQIREEMSHDKDWGKPGSVKHAKKITPGQANEGTWAIPKTPKDKAALKKLMSQPIKLGKEGDEAAGKIYSLIGDDELFDDLYVAGKKNPNGDARPIIKKHMKRLRISEAKDPNEYDKEGEMMKNQLRQICSANEKLMKMVGDDDNLPEWVQNKVTKATDYIRSVRDYLEAENGNDDDDEEEMDEANGSEITVGGYTTKHFHMCGSAIKTMKKNSNVKNAEQMTRLQDQFYKMEKDVMNAGEATDEQKSMAQNLYNKIMGLAKSAGIEKEVGGYMKMHLDSVMKGKPKPGFGRVDINEAKRTVTIDRPDSIASIRVMKPKDPSKFNQDKKYPPHLRGDSIGKARKAFKDMRRSSTGK